RAAHSRLPTACVPAPDVPPVPPSSARPGCRPARGGLLHGRPAPGRSAHRPARVSWCTSWRTTLPLEVRFKSSHALPMMPIGEVPRQAGLRPPAIRYYERIGLLPAPERSSGRRRYGPDVLARLTVIRFARGNGFTVREIRDLLGGRPYSARLRMLAHQ